MIILWKCHSWTESIQVEQKKEERIKADEKYKGLLDRLVAVTGGTGEPTEESAASSNQVVHSSNVFLMHKQMYHTQKLKFYKN